jgi:hypothetical protein
MAKDLNNANAKVICMKKMWLAILMCLVLPIAYGVQVNSSTEIYWFNVTECQANVSSVGCSAENIRMNCSISNYAFIDYVDFEIDDVYYESDQYNDHFWYDYYKPVTTVDTDTEIEWQKVKIYDVGTGVANFFPNIYIDHQCDACDYNVSYGTCNISDLRVVEYVGDGSANCTDYNATESCDYCTPLWSITSDCLVNNTEFREYSDANSCYALTGLYADSCDYSYTDCDTWINCSFLGVDFTCGYDANPLIEIAGNRIFWYCQLTNTSQDYNCISYVKQAGHTVQTNPQQKTFSTGLLSREQESREFFTAENGLVNPYFTTDNLKHNMTYIFGVECTSDNGRYTTEHYVTPLYENLDEIAYRGVWLRDNLGYVLGGLITLVVVVLIISWVVK